MNTMTVRAPGTRPVGELLREWRERRRLSQLDLAIQADISARHLSFVETGRSQPTAGMILRLTEQLQIPLRERNVLLLAGHEPYPAVVVDRWWNMVDSNSGVAVLVGECAPELLEPPVNVLRLSLHPDGMAPRIVNLGQWRPHLLSQLRHRAAALGDPRLSELYEELRKYPGGIDEAHPPEGVVLPLRYRHGDRELALFSISAAVATATDVTVDELAVESFYPADAATAAALRS
jgi:transcriptional regulator with XRE-family HTH domain